MKNLGNVQSLAQRLKGVNCWECMSRGHACQAQMFDGSRPLCLKCADGEPCLREKVGAAGISRKFGGEQEPFDIPAPTSQDREFAEALNTAEGLRLKKKRLTSEELKAEAKAKEERREAAAAAERERRRRLRALTAKPRAARPVVVKEKIETHFERAQKLGIVEMLKKDRVAEVSAKTGWCKKRLNHIAHKMGAEYVGHRFPQICALCSSQLPCTRCLHVTCAKCGYVRNNNMRRRRLRIGASQKMAANSPFTREIRDLILVDLEHMRIGEIATKYGFSYSQISALTRGRQHYGSTIVQCCVCGNPRGRRRQNDRCDTCWEKWIKPDCIPKEIMLTARGNLASVDSVTAFASSTRDQ